MGIDVIITRGRDRCYIHPQTDRARKWVEQNVITDLPEHVVAINTEYLEEFIKDMESAELHIDIH